MAKPTTSQLTDAEIGRRLKGDDGHVPTAQIAVFRALMARVAAHPDGYTPNLAEIGRELSMRRQAVSRAYAALRAKGVVIERRELVTLATAEKTMIAVSLPPEDQLLLPFSRPAAALAAEI